MRVFKHFEWREPGCPPGGILIRDEPLAKHVKYPSLTRELERELILRCWNGDQEALERLVGAHRPMVVRMAYGMWRGNGTPLKALVEYGMLGLRIAAKPLRPSETKKGKMVGFDFAKPYRFSTYARHYARKEMRAAIAGDLSPALKPEFAQKATVEIESWNEPRAEEWERDDDDMPLRLFVHNKVLFRELQQRRPYHKPRRRQDSLWYPPKSQLKPSPQRERHIRRKTPITDSEWTAKDLYHTAYWPSLETYESLAKGGLEGWSDVEDADASFLVASFLRNHAFDSKNYRLPDEVMRKRWRMGCKRYELIIPFNTNDGLGQFDRHGQWLPDFSFREGGIRRPSTGPYLCMHPVASIYLVRGGEVFGFRRLRLPAWAYSHEYSQRARSRSLDPTWLPYWITSPKMEIVAAYQYHRWQRAFSPPGAPMGAPNFTPQMETEHENHD